MCNKRAPQAAKEMFKRYDKTNDGTIGYEEFKSQASLNSSQTWCHLKVFTQMLKT